VLSSQSRLSNLSSTSRGFTVYSRTSLLEGIQEPLDLKGYNLDDLKDTNVIEELLPTFSYLQDKFDEFMAEGLDEYKSVLKSEGSHKISMWAKTTKIADGYLVSTL
jgi:hypothetical protein